MEKSKEENAIYYVLNKNSNELCEWELGEKVECSFAVKTWKIKRSPISRRETVRFLLDAIDVGADPDSVYEVAVKLRICNSDVIDGIRANFSYRKVLISQHDCNNESLFKTTVLSKCDKLGYNDRCSVEGRHIFEAYAKFLKTERAEREEEIAKKRFERFLQDPSLPWTRLQSSSKYVGWDNTATVTEPATREVSVFGVPITYEINNGRVWTIPGYESSIPMHDAIVPPPF